MSRHATRQDEIAAGRQLFALRSLQTPGTVGDFGFCRAMANSLVQQLNKRKSRRLDRPA